MLESACERPIHDEKPKTSSHKKRHIDCAKYLLRGFAPWINRFGCSVFRKMVKEADEGNVAIAANTVFVLMGGLSCASVEEDTGETCEALFGKAPSDFDKLAIKMFRMFGDLVVCKWNVASSVFLPSSRKLERDFCEKMENRYGVKVRTLPSKDVPDATAAINKFVRDQSQHLTNIIPSGEEILEKSDNSMVAAIAVYVHPWWRCRFEKGLTTYEMFYESEDEPLKVQLMHRESTFSYVEADLREELGVQVVGIPCRGQKVMVYFVLPKERFGLSDVLSCLTGDRASRLIDNCHPHRVRVSIPRMHMCFNTELRPTFSELGMNAWFDADQPAFDAIARRGGAVSLGRVYHQVVLKMDEEGDEPEGVEPYEGEDDAVEFKCDQPFVILLYHTVTNAIWTLIQVSHPSKRGPQPAQ